MERRINVRVRRILYAFGWLVALALAVGAGWLLMPSLSPIIPIVRRDDRRAR